eukprot:scaffold1998_cov179-Ochromonas_danica.AAC.1
MGNQKSFIPTSSSSVASHPPPASALRMSCCGDELPSGGYEWVIANPDTGVQLVTQQGMAKGSRQIRGEEETEDEDEDDDREEEKIYHSDDDDNSSCVDDTSFFFPLLPQKKSLCLLYSLFNLIDTEEGRQEFDLPESEIFLGRLPSNEDNNEDLSKGLKARDLVAYLQHLQFDRRVLKRWIFERPSSLSRLNSPDKLRELFRMTRRSKVPRQYILTGISSPTDVRGERIKTLERKFSKWSEPIPNPLGWMAMQMNLPSATYRSHGQLLAVRAEQKRGKEREKRKKRKERKRKRSIPTEEEEEEPEDEEEEGRTTLPPSQQLGLVGGGMPPLCNPPSHLNLRFSLS